MRRISFFRIRAHSSVPSGDEISSRLRSSDFDELCRARRTSILGLKTAMITSRRGTLGTRRQLVRSFDLAACGFWQRADEGDNCGSFEIFQMFFAICSYLALSQSATFFQYHLCPDCL